MLWGWHFKKCICSYSNLWYFHQSEGMTYGTEAMQKRGRRNTVVGKDPEITIWFPLYIQSQLPETGKSCHLWAPARTGCWAFYNPQKNVGEMEAPERLACVIQGLRLAKRWNWDLELSLNFLLLLNSIPLTLSKYYFCPAEAREASGRMLSALSTFQRFTDGASLEQFSINKGLLLKGALSFFCLCYCCYCLLSGYPIQPPLFLIAYSLWDEQLRWKNRKTVFSNLIFSSGCSIA